MQPAAPQLAGSTVPVIFTITTGEEGLQPNGYALIDWTRNGGVWCGYAFTNPTVTSSKADATFDVLLNDGGGCGANARHMVRATLTSGSALGPGETITVRGTMEYARQVPCAGALQAAVHPTGSATEYLLQNTFPVSVVHRPAARFWISAEARPVVGSATRLTVAVVDPYGNPVRDYDGTITASTDVPVAGLPITYTFADTDVGTRSFVVTFPTAGKVARIKVASAALSGISNPILPRAASEPGIFFGDIHAHSTISDGFGNPDDEYDYARQVAGLDFAALTDHDPLEGSTRWTDLLAATRRHHDAPRFATLLGYEFSRDGIHGHRNVYYPDDQGPAEPVVPDYIALWTYLDQSNIRALTIPHHPNTSAPCGQWGPTDWSVINDTYQRLVEIFQGRGSFELPSLDPELKVTLPDEGSSVQAALAQGHRVGFIASTDSHSARMGAYRSGLTGVFSPALYRGKIFNRMYMRQCYAVTGDRMLLFFYVNGNPMGRELSVAPTTNRKIHWRAIGQAPIKRVDLLRNNVVYKSWTGDGVADDMTGGVTDTAPLSGGEWWYLRVIQTNGQLGWASPIWVDPR